MLTLPPERFGEIIYLFRAELAGNFDWWEATGADFACFHCEDALKFTLELFGCAPVAHPTSGLALKMPALFFKSSSSYLPSLHLYR